MYKTKWAPLTKHLNVRHKVIKSQTHTIFSNYPTPSRVKQKSSGFTLVELMIVIAITGIITAIAIPNFRLWKKNAAFRGSVTRIRAEMLRTKLIAFKTGHEVRMELCEDTDNSYQIIEGDRSSSSSYTLHGGACPMSEANRTAYLAESREVTVGNLTDYPGVTLADTTGNANPFIEFSPKGTADVFRTFRINDDLNTQDIVVSMVGRIRLR